MPVAETIVQPGETTVKPASAKSTAMKPASVKSTPVEAAKSAAVKSPAAVGRSTGEVWLAKRSSAKQSSCEDCQSFSHPRSGSSFC
jgi:hypothetical protein